MRSLLRSQTNLARRNKVFYIQKQPFADVFWKRCSSKFRNIHRKTSVLESLLNDISELKAYSIIKKYLQRRCFPVNITKFLRTAFLIDHLVWLLLHNCLFLWNKFGPVDEPDPNEKSNLILRSNNLLNIKNTVKNNTVLQSQKQSSGGIL